MDTFGDRLKNERQDRGLSIQVVGEILGVDHDRLQALERNDFAALPDEAAMMECLHGYAECLEVDADLMIEDYLQERDKYLRGLEDVVVEPVAETAPAAIPTEEERRPRVLPWLAALVIVAIAMFVSWWMLPRNGAAPKPETSVATAPVEEQPLSSEEPADVAPTPAEVAQIPVELPRARPAPEAPAQVEAPPARSAPAASAPSRLSIVDHGVGTSVEDRRLVGRSDSFSEGTQVWFWTQVQGGTRGDRIDHVWLMEGVEVSRISLEIGGSSWRTSSTKTLQGGIGSEWVVEARDGAGRVLARSEFVSTF